MPEVIAKIEEARANGVDPQMKRAATRYLGPTRESRDFFAISLPVS